MDDIKLGDTLYTIAQDIESYGIEEAPRRPYKVKITQISDNPHISPTYKVQCFNKETGIVDDDSNATAYVRKHELFITIEEAKKAYVIARKEHVQYLLRKAFELVDDDKVAVIIKKAYKMLGGD